ncbi:hypothetical protein OIE99_17120 [Streptomyces cellulosae]|uniref:hypothetical protein n=1 Tax=unclassified Streptomyces TaxID=2593676 RepID=UPI00039F67A3|nr:hypothetical protein [Streptomyces sp. SID8376]WTB89852.1 hypothetical protein OIE99_17120 [Streptomyces cellulosae]
MSERRPLSTISCATAVLALCAASCSQPSTDEHGRLRIEMTGLPKRVQGRVVVRGPDGDTFTLRSTAERKVKPGIYRISFPGVRVGNATTYTADDAVRISIKEGKVTTVPADYKVTIPDTTTVLDPEETGIEAVHGNKVTFSANAPEADKIRRGQIVIAGAGPNSPGLLPRRVIAVEKQGSALIATTEPVPLNMALPEGAVTFADRKSALAGDPASSSLTPEVLTTAAYAPYAPLQKDPEKEPNFSFEFAGFQVGARLRENPNNAANSQNCAAEIPGMRYSIHGFELDPSGGYGWTKGSPTPKGNISVKLTYDSSLEVTGRVDIKCIDQFESNAFGIDRLCKSKILKVIKVGMFGPSCSATGIFKGTVLAESGDIQGKLSGKTVVDFVSNPKSRKPAHVNELSFKPTAKMTNSGTKYKVAVDAAVEVFLGLELLPVPEGLKVVEPGPVVDLGVGVELSAGMEVAPGSTQAPTQGKVFLRSGLDAGKYEPQPEFQLFKWKRDLLQPSPEEKPAIPHISLNRDQVKDSGLVNRLGRQLRAEKGHNIRLSLDVEEGANVRINPPGASSPPGNDIWLNDQCDGTCTKIIIDVPEELMRLDVEAAQVSLDREFSVQDSQTIDGMMFVRLGKPL